VELMSFKASEQVQAKVAELAQDRGLNKSAAIKAAIAEATRKDKTSVTDKPELLELLTESARGGNVTAMKTLWSILSALESEQGQGEDVLDELDELARRRA
jgi:predicted transcriptional regulator